MPGGGIGPVRLRTLLACVAHDRVIGAVGNTNEIFFHLDARRVFFDRTAGYLYFTGAADDLVQGTLRATLAGMNCTPEVEQLHLDTHRFFSAACRVALTGEQASAALVALRLAGVRATIR